MSGGYWRDKQKERQLEMSEVITGEKCLVSTTATDADDTVQVTLPNSESPNTRIEVQWRLGVKEIAGTLHPRYPQRGDEGVVFYDDEKEPWLIY